MILYPNSVDRSWLLANEASEDLRRRILDDSSFRIMREIQCVTAYRTERLTRFMKYHLFAFN